jgi:hypothetical protein
MGRAHVAAAHDQHAESDPIHWTPPSSPKGGIEFQPSDSLTVLDTHN